MWLSLFSRSFFRCCRWNYWCDCWCVVSCCWCSIFIFNFYCCWIWCACEVFVWCEGYDTCQWINLVFTNFFSIFCCWNFFVFNWLSVHYEFSWLLFVNCDWRCFITLSKLRCTFLWLSLFSTCSYIFSCWFNWSYCWGVSSFYFCSVSIFRCNFNWIWRSYEIFVWLECNDSSFWIDCVCSNFFSIFLRWNTCYFFISFWIDKLNCCFINWCYFITFSEHCLSILCLWLSLFSRSFFRCCRWNYWCDCWCVVSCCWCSIFIFNFYCCWIWCACEVFVWCEGYDTCQWINLVFTNFFSIFCCWNFFVFNRLSVHYEFSWLLFVNCNWCYFITLCEFRCSFLWLSLFTA